MRYSIHKKKFVKIIQIEKGDKNFFMPKMRKKENLNGWALAIEVGSKFNFRPKFNQRSA